MKKKQMYLIKLGAIEMELPSLKVEEYDKFAKDTYLSLFLGDEGLSSLRTQFKNAVRRGDYEVIKR